MQEEPATTPDNEADVAQEPVGRENVEGGGEWPDPETPPTGPAGGETTRDDSAPTPTTFKDVLESDPVAGGSASIGEAEPTTPADNAER